MFTLKELDLLHSKIYSEMELIRQSIMNEILESPSNDLIRCLHLDSNGFSASYFSSSRSLFPNCNISVKITCDSIIGDEHLTDVEKNYCLYLQSFIIDKKKEHYGI